MVGIYLYGEHFHEHLDHRSATLLAAGVMMNIGVVLDTITIRFLF